MTKFKVTPSLVSTSGSVSPDPVTSVSSGTVSRDFYPLRLTPDILSLRCVSEDATSLLYGPRLEMKEQTSTE
jgi:hypothetical protein